MNSSVVSEKQDDFDNHLVGAEQDDVDDRIQGGESNDRVNRVASRKQEKKNKSRKFAQNVPAKGIRKSPGPMDNCIHREKPVQGKRENSS